MSGWFAVKRGITDHPLFHKRPDRLAIWLWLLDHVAWRETEFDVHGTTISLAPGSISVSERRIAEEVGVGRQVVRTFLGRLEGENMITLTANPPYNTARNVITLCNWGKYQSALKEDNPLPNPTLTQHQPIKEQDNNSAKAGGAVDPVKIMFDRGRSLLAESGKSGAAAGSLLGKWRKEHGTEAVIAAIGRAQREGAIDPAAFIEGCLRSRAPAQDEFGAFGKLKDLTNGR